jgi:hemerythrin
MDEDFVVWSDEYSVEFGPLDEQHKKLVDITNELLKICKEGSKVSRMDFMLSFSKAGDYARTHFSSEEEYMQKAGYPALDVHKKEHENFLAEVKNAFNEFKESDSAPSGLAIFLKKWLLNHIAVKDKQYVPYLAKGQLT